MMEMLTQQEESLADQVRSEMLARYGELTRGVELRQARAEWRVKRMNLQEKRIKFLQSEERRWRDDSEEHGEGQSEPALPLHDQQQFLPSSHDYDTTSHDQEISSHDDTASPDLSSLKEIEEDKADLADSASDRELETTAPLEHANLLNQQIVDVHSELHSAEHQISSVVVTQPFAPSAKEPIYPDAVVNKQGYPHSLTISGPDEAGNEQGYPCIFSTRGQAPKSTIEEIIYSSGEPLSQKILSTRGRAPPTTIQYLLYPLRQATPTNLNKSGSHDNQEGTDDDSVELVELGPSAKFTDLYDLLGWSQFHYYYAC